jgi:hypothetical protein
MLRVSFDAAMLLTVGSISATVSRRTTRVLSMASAGRTTNISRNRFSYKPQAKPAAAAKDPLVCRKLQETGSRTAGKEVCQTASQWEQQQ